ncbi:MAG: DUF2513 domain-containing protein [Anaerolineae bacterium]|nr:DUF2513 domain-containing protein [Anaerolineae bacterium]
MKRDPDLIRNILLILEKTPHGETEQFEQSDLLDQLAIAATVDFHLRLLTEAGLITPDEGGDGRLRLTWDGYEFLDAARSDDNWQKVKKAMERTGGFTIRIAEAVLGEIIKNQALRYLP